MAVSNLKTGSQVKLKDQLLSFVCYTKNDELNFRVVETGNPLVLTEDEFDQAYANGDLVFCDEDLIIDQQTNKEQQKISVDLLTSAEREETLKREKLVKLISKRREFGFTLKQAARDAITRCAESDPSYTRVGTRQGIRYYNMWKRSGCCFDALIPRYCNRGGRGAQMSPEVYDLFNETVQQVYLQRTRGTMAKVHSELRLRISRLNAERPENLWLRCPSVRTVQREINRIDPYLRMSARYGSRAADKEFGAANKGLIARHPLDIVQMDHTLLDVNVLRWNGKIVGRPWLTVAMDLYSRMIVGFYLSFDRPNYNAVMQCLRFSIISKKSHLQHISESSSLISIEREWPCRGIPETVVLDNGLEFHSNNMLSACAQLGTDIEFNPKYTPHYKGAVERFFKTLNTGLIHTLPGTTYSNPREKGDYESEKEAILTFEDLRQLLTKFIVDEYSQKEHKGLQHVPIQMWRKGTKKKSPRLPAKVSDLAVLTNCTETRKLRDCGIEIFGHLFYASEELDLLRRQLMANSGDHKNNPEVVVKYDPNDISHVYVVDTINKTNLMVPSTFPEYTKGLTEWQHNYLRKLRKEEMKSRKYSTEDELTVLKQSVFEAAQAMVSGHKKSLQNAARYTQGGSDESSMPRKIDPSKNTKTVRRNPENPRAINMKEVKKRFIRKKWNTFNRGKEG